MRDNHNGLIELLEVSNSNNIYSCTIGLSTENEYLKVRFGIEPIDYINLIRIVQFKPFENTGVAPYRYFFSLSYLKIENNLALTWIWVEQLKDHKQFKFEVTQKLIANLHWFDTLKNKDLIKDMIV